MKRKMVLILIFSLFLSSCQLTAPVVQDPEKVQPEVVVTEEEPSEVNEPSVEADESESEVVESEETEPGEGQKLSIEIQKQASIFLDAFVEINLVDENESFVEIPVFKGPTNLVNFWNQEVNEKFYTEYLNYWEQIKDTQATLNDEEDFKNFTVFRIQSSVFEDSSNLVLLARNYNIYGYSLTNRDSAVFYIDKTTGDALEPADQLSGYGKTMEDALATLSLFQEENSQISFDDLTVDERKALYEEAEAIQYNLAVLYGTDKPVILNDFRSPEAYMNTEIFVAEIDGKEYYVVKLLLASLEENMLDGSYRDDIWIGLPADYDGGVLHRHDQYPGPLDAIYK